MQTRIINRKNNPIIRKLIIDKNKDGEIVPRLETVEVVLVHCNLVNNNYQQASKVLFTFVPNKQFGQLITITPHSPTMLKTANSELKFGLQTKTIDHLNRRQCEYYTHNWNKLVLK